MTCGVCGHAAHGEGICRTRLGGPGYSACRCGGESPQLDSLTLAEAMAATQQKHPRWQPLNRGGFEPWAERIIAHLNEEGVAT